MVDACVVPELRHQIGQVTTASKTEFPAKLGLMWLFLQNYIVLKTGPLCGIFTEHHWSNSRQLVICLEGKDL